MSRLFALLSALFLTSTAMAQDFSGLARIDANKSQLSDARRGGVSLELALSQGVPWRIFQLDDPRRLVLDFREVDWRGFDGAELGQVKGVADLRYGQFRPGWSRMVLDLAEPLNIDKAGLRVNEVDGSAILDVQLVLVEPAAFTARSGAPHDPRWDLPEPAAVKPTQEAQPDWAPIVVVLDPGHGGIDPGAEREGAQEKDLMLRFAREIRDTLRRTGGFEVILTRDEDVFVSLPRRVSIAHEVGADVFISLHADSLQQGRATGATVYTLSDEASDKASTTLAERHDRADILAGIDLTGSDDRLADALLDLARMETLPRTKLLAATLVQSMQDASGTLNTKPLRQAGFSVLKAADIPSVLIEVGFMSSEADWERLNDPNWRALMAGGIRDGLLKWRNEDKVLRDLVRQ